jgi:hypothetical protein
LMVEITTCNMIAPFSISNIHNTGAMLLSPLSLYTT